MKIKMSTFIASLAFIFAACSPIEKEDVLVAPSDVKVEQTGLSEVRLTWTNASSSYDGVIIDRASLENGPEYKEIARPGYGVLIYKDKNHAGESTYKYRLTTFRGDKRSESVEIEFAYSRLPMPTELKCEATADGLVISWKDNCTGEEGYIVRKKVGSGSFADWKALPANATSVTDPEAVSGSYDYEVRAFAGDDRSAAIHDGKRNLYSL